MRRLIEILLGIDPAPWAEGGSWHVQFLSLPKHGWAVLLLAAIPLTAWGVMLLYRREGRTLVLESNSRLQTALRLYEKAGFVMQPSVRPGSHYERADVYMIYKQGK